MKTKLRHRYLLKKMSEYIKNNNIGGECFIESGVKYGNASVVICKELNKKGYLFDTWTNLPHFNDHDAFTYKRRLKLKKRVRGGKDTYKECIENLKTNGVSNLCEMIRGDICKTIPKFVNDTENLSISLIHSDSDLYDPTKITLTKLWPFLVDGGMILIHDYQTKQWPGIEKSVDEFVSSKKGILTNQFYKNVTASFLIMKDEKNKYKDDFDAIVKHVNNEFPFKE